jgi:hypothetical protein
MRILNINPFGKVPVIQYDDKVIFESRIDTVILLKQYRRRWFNIRWFISSRYVVWVIEHKDFNPLI